MRTLGLTGGIGMGKSLAARFFHERGAKVVDTDELAHQLVEPGRPALAEIQAAFGKNLVAPGGQLHRNELAQIVFADPAARKKLEAILHPRIRDCWLAQLEAWRKADYKLAVVVIPLLFETGAEASFDKTACTACSEATQHRRLADRGWTPEQINQRVAAQWPIDQKISHANFVIWTDGSLDSHLEQIERIIAQL